MNLFPPELTKYIIIWAIVVIILWFIYKIYFLDNKVSDSDQGRLPYIPKQYFFEYSELEFYRILSAYLSKEYLGKYDIFPKVRLWDLAEGRYRKDNNKISQKHIDFLIVDKTKHCTPVLAIELNWGSHEREDRQESDDFKRRFFNIIQINFLTITNDELKNSDNIIEKINNILK